MADVGLRRFERTWIDATRDPGAIEAPLTLNDTELVELGRGRAHRLDEVFLRFWRT